MYSQWSGAGVLAQFAQDQVRRGLRPATITTRRRILWSLERWLDGPLEHVTADQIEAWLDSRRLSSRSRYTYLSAVASFFEFAIRRGAVEKDPTKEIGRPRLPRLVPRPAAPEDVTYAIEQAEPMMAAWLSLATFQGLRCMEISKLRREDVQEHREPPLLVVSDGKGGRQDVMTLNAQVELALRDFGMPRHGFLFLTRDGTPYKPASVSRYIGKYLRGLGINATAHQLRHLFGTTMWQRTKDLRVTQETMRHADPRTTAGYTAYDRQEASRVVRGLRLGDERKLTFPEPSEP